MGKYKEVTYSNGIEPTTISGDISEDSEFLTVKTIFDKIQINKKQIITIHEKMP